MFSQLPMYQRVGKSAFKKDLTNIKKLCKGIANPEKSFSSIHIAGTNGKGSTAHQLAAVLQCAGFKVGLYSSPHYIDFRERIKIDGVFISEKEVIDFIHSNDRLIDDIKPSFFEITVAMAFDHFSKREVDFAIVETGLGGRLDSTNVLLPILSIITNVSLDHQNMLGNTISKIAKEKAGIIKKEVPVVLGEYNESYTEIMKRKAEKNNAAIHIASKNFKLSLIKTHRNYQHCQIKRKGRDYLELKIPSKGKYQWKNLLTALQSIAVLQRHSKVKIPKKAILNGIENYPKLTKFMGRWELIAKNPFIILDSAHNIAGIKEALKGVGDIKHDKLHIVMGFVKDKEINPLLALFPKSASYYFTRAKIPRAMDEVILMKQASELGLKGRPYKRSVNALKAAKRKAGKADAILIIGSIFLIGEYLS